MPDASAPGFAALWQAFLDGGLEPAQAEALERLLREDAATAAHAADLYVEHRLIGLALKQEDEARFARATMARLADEGRSFADQVRLRLTPAQPIVVPLPAPAPARRLPGWPLAALAASLLAATLLLRPGPPAPQPDFTPPAVAADSAAVATLVLIDGVRWQGAAPTTGQRLAAGDLELSTGHALLRFAGGAEALLDAPVALRLESGGSALVRRGTVTVRAAAQAAGFILRSPVAEVTDLGTEFALSVEPGGATTLQVVEGDISWRALDVATAGPGAALHAGQALRVRDAGDRTGEALAFSAPSIAARLAQPAGVVAGEAPGVLLSYDGFAYPFATTTSRQHQADGGFGWRSPWYRNQLDNGLVMDFTPGTSLAAPAGLRPGQGGTMELPTEPERPDTYRDACMRLFAEPIHLDGDAVRYLSVLVRRSAVTAGPTHHWLRCMLTSQTVPADRLGFGVLSNGRPELIGRFGNSVADAPLVDGEPYLMVLKVSCARGAPGQTFLKVYGQRDAVDAYEPARWTVVGQAGRFPGVLGSLHIYNGTERAWSIDEVRIGTTWQSVTPRS
jgi:hypothetical protein